jgi:hypothetical protein
MNNKESNELRSLKEITTQGSAWDELIVELNFEHDGTTYHGRRIMSRHDIGKLCAGLQINRDIIIPPHEAESYFNTTDVKILQRAFTIHSDKPEDVASMREQFGESVGDTRLFDSVIKRKGYFSPTIIREDDARDFLRDPLMEDCSEATGIEDDAAELLSNYEGDLFFVELVDISDAAIESLSKHRGNLTFGSLTELSDAAAESLSKHQGRLTLATIGSLSDAAAESLSKHEGVLCLGLYELSDAAAQALSKHKGDLFLDDILELSDVAANYLSKKEGRICRMDPAAWVDSLTA